MSYTTTVQRSYIHDFKNQLTTKRSDFNLAVDLVSHQVEKQHKQRMSTTMEQNQQKLANMLEQHHHKLATEKEQHQLKLATMMEQHQQKLATIKPIKVKSTPPLEPLQFTMPSLQSNTNTIASMGLTMVDDDIPEDSIYRKILACIPLIGIIPSLMNKSSLVEKIRESWDTSISVRLIKLISILSHYNIATIVRTILTVASIVASVAYGIMGGGSLTIGVSLAIGISWIAYQGFLIHKSRQDIKMLQTYYVRDR